MVDGLNLKFPRHLNRPHYLLAINNLAINVRSISNVNPGKCCYVKFMNQLDLAIVKLEI